MNGYGRLLVIVGAVSALSAFAAAQVPPSGIPGISSSTVDKLLAGIGHQSDPIADALAVTNMQKDAAAGALTFDRLTSVAGLPDKKPSPVLSPGPSMGLDKIIGSTAPPIAPITSTGTDSISIPTSSVDSFEGGFVANAWSGSTGGGWTGGGGWSGGGGGGCDPVPEPGTMLALGLGASAVIARRKKRKQA